MLRTIGVLIAATALSVPAGRAAPDEYFRIARVSFVEGNVSFQHQGDPEWGAVTINLSLQPGDRLYTGRSGRVEVEFDDGSVLRLAEETDVELLSMREDLIQMRQSLGLSTLTVRSGLEYEVGTPAAAFRALKNGVYRFDVIENGDSDGIVRKGHLEATNGKFTTRADSGELIHVTAGDNARYLISRYEGRDDWDNWNDRRNAELNAYESRRYLPDYVYVGVSDLDYHGRWVVVDGYGPGWIPSGVGYGWSPYWEGRWVYRPIWGWTWVSYEPWGWLPYHYGRWHHSASFGWCWLPGASFSFHFWSPGVVRFHRGPGWVSWTPLGPRDYYNANHYFYNPRYSGHLNSMRLLERRSPDDLANRHVPGAIRTVSTDSFAGERLGSRGRGTALVASDRGRVVTDRLDVEPNRRSYVPDPDRQATRPGPGSTRPSIVRAAPSVDPGSDRVRRVEPGPERSAASRGSSAIVGRDTNPARPSQFRAYESAGSALRGSGDTSRGSSIWNRSGRGDTANEGPSPRVYTSPGRTETPAAPVGRGDRLGVPGREAPSVNRGGSATENSRSTRGRETPGIMSPRSAQPPESRRVAPAARPSRIESAPSRGQERSRPTAPPRSDPPGMSSFSSGRSFPGFRELPSSSAYERRSFSSSIGRGVEAGRAQSTFSRRAAAPSASDYGSRSPAPYAVRGASEGPRQSIFSRGSAVPSSAPSRPAMSSPMRSAPGSSRSSVQGGRSGFPGARAGSAPSGSRGGRSAITRGRRN